MPKKLPHFTALLADGTQEWTFRFGNPGAGNEARIYPEQKLIVLRKGKRVAALEYDVDHEVIHQATPLDEPTVLRLEADLKSARKALMVFISENPDLVR